MVHKHDIASQTIAGGTLVHHSVTDGQQYEYKYILLGHKDQICTWSQSQRHLSTFLD